MGNNIHYQKEFSFFFSPNHPMGLNHFCNVSNSVLQLGSLAHFTMCFCKACEPLLLEPSILVQLLWFLHVVSAWLSQLISEPLKFFYGHDPGC